MALNFRMLISQVDPSRQRESILGPMDGFVYAPISLGQRTILTAYGLRTGCYLKVLDVGPTMEKSTSWKWSMEMVASLVHTTGSTKKHGKLRVLTTHEHLNRNPQYPKQRCSDHDVRPISYICIHYVLTAFEQGRAFKSRHILVPNWDKDWHEYAIEWDGKSYIKYYINGVLYNVVRGSKKDGRDPDESYFAGQPMYLMLGTAIASKSTAGMAYPVSDDTLFPNHHYIDEVIVSQRG
mmetsp:Transcript_33053/g.63859  ORF Transcript_33053/g.63859 Transcript_33053/m.63859 type:complete len:237 (+) Transcript_33053:474-1184(+)